MRGFWLIVYECVAWALVLGMALLIVQFSAQDGDQSARLSMEVTDVAMLVAAPDAPVDRAGEGYRHMHQLVRKLAHAAEYALLALLLLAALAPFRMRLGARLSLALALCAAFAGLDEWRQGYADGRTPAPGDVLIDTAGAAFGAALALLGRWFALLLSRVGPFWRALGRR